MASSVPQNFERLSDYGMKMPYETFHIKSGCTFENQDSLPPMPVPDLDASLSNYLESVKPYLSEEEFRKTESAVSDFGQGEGKIMQEKLKEKAQGSRNWLEQYWEDFAYLYSRVPLGPTCNMLGPGPYHRTGWPAKSGSCVERAALFVWYSLKYWDLFRRELRMIDKGAGKVPWCMHLYHRIFNSCRIPGEHKDEIAEYFKSVKEGECPTHLTVICKGHIFKMETLDKDGEIRTAPEIQYHLQHIYDTAHATEGLGLGVLTSEERTTWHKLREHLLSIHPENKDNLESIQSSISVLSLEDSEPADMEEVIGKTYKGNPKNFWYDKSLGCVVFENGFTSCSCDHAPAEGIAFVTMSYWNFLGLEKSGYKWAGPKSIRNFELPKMLNFHVDSVITQGIDTAAEKFRKSKDMEHKLLFFDDFGRELLKKYRIPIDMFIQVALQVAYYKIHRRPAPTYETAPLRKFYHGRTETVRSCTMQSLAFSKAMVDESSPMETKARLMLAALEKHGELMMNACEMNSCDRHLMALQILSMENGRPLHSIYSDPAFTRSGGNGNYILSTSYLGSLPSGGLVPPMCKDGYGVFYATMPNSINVIVVAWEEDADTDAVKLSAAMQQTFHDMLAIAESSTGQSKI